MMPPDAGLENWLERISQIHPREIELGLERIRQVATKLNLLVFDVPVVTIAGTNGKGSCVAVLESILVNHGISKVGCYTSPHIHLYNERIRISGQLVTDKQLCKAFAVIDAARAAVSLSYFEFSTLAALYLFKQLQVEVIILEVGLGGRLDAANVVDADLAVISSIGIDHTDWLGHSIDEIGREKAGICRAGKPVVLGMTEPPKGLVNEIAARGALVHQLGRHFTIQISSVSNSNIDGSEHTVYVYHENETGCHFNDLHHASLDISNIASSIQAARLLGVEVKQSQLIAALADTQVAGRFEFRRDKLTRAQVLLDVAHNPDATRNLLQKLHTWRHKQKTVGRILLVVSVMADKDAQTMCRILESSVDIWYISQVEEARGLLAKDLAKHVATDATVFVHSDIQKAYNEACLQAKREDIVLVCGCFAGVGALRENTD